MERHSIINEVSGDESDLKVEYQDVCAALAMPALSINSHSMICVHAISWISVQQLMPRAGAMKSIIDFLSLLLLLYMLCIVNNPDSPRLSSVPS